MTRSRPLSALRFAPSLAVALGVGAAMVAGCGPNAGETIDAEPDPTDPNQPPGCRDASCKNHCEDGKRTVLRGQVLAPNGIDPIPGAVVYVPNQVNEFPPEVRCEVCDSIVGDAIVSTATEVDGSFTLEPLPTAVDQQPGATIEVIAQIGRFRKRATVAIESPCADNTAPAATFQLPGKTSGFDSIPNIAVVTGAYDVMECVLLNMGIEQDAFDLYNGQQSFGGFPTSGTVGDFDVLLNDLAKMRSYNVIFINCSNNDYENLLSDSVVRSNIEQYVREGGRLYVTDWSYDYLEQVEAFAPLIDFGPGASDNTPEPKDSAAMGDGGITTEATVLDEHMRAWLEAVERVTGEEIVSDAGQVHIEHFLASWVMQFEAALVDNVKVWLTGQVSGGGLSGELPLTTTFDYEQCGRVLYSSYHTAGRETPLPTFPGYCSADGLSPQERVLMYLILHISDCITIE